MEKLSICKTEQLIKLTIEWPMDYDTGYIEACDYIDKKYPGQRTRTFRMGPKPMTDSKMDSSIRQLVIEVYRS